MIKAEVLAGINKQIQHEFAAAYSYLALSTWFEAQVFKGFAAWFLKQFKEEQEHAMKLLEYVQDSGGQAALEAIDAPRMAFANAAEACKAALEMERKNTASINALHALAAKHGDLATQQMLQWFINEQVEEEKWADEFATLTERMTGHAPAMYMLDHRVSKLVEKPE